MQIPSVQNASHERSKIKNDDDLLSRRIRRLQFQVIRHGLYISSIGICDIKIVYLSVNCNKC